MIVEVVVVVNFGSIEVAAQKSVRCSLTEALPVIVITHFGCSVAAPQSVATAATAVLPVASLARAPWTEIARSAATAFDPFISSG